MRWLHKLWMRILMLFNRAAAGERLEEELQFHIERQINENIGAGMSREEARRAALRSFGNATVLREQARASWSWNWLESTVRDLHISLRILRRTPGFALIAMLVIALGIGANVALFTVVRSVLLRPLPFKDPDRLVRLYEHTSDRFPSNNSAAGIFAEWRKQSHSFSDLAISGYARYNLSGTGGQLPEEVPAAHVSWNLLPTLGVESALGRGFTAADDRLSANGTVILSSGLWKRRFSGDPSIVGETILLNAKPYTVIGIMPSWFAYPDHSVQLWTPLYHEEQASEVQALDSHDFQAIGRLKQGVTADQAAAELSLITRRLHDQHRDDPFVSDAASIRPLLDDIVGDVRTPLYVLLIATGCVLLIACLNVANLLVARAAARRRELAIRTALGGSRLRLLCAHLMESLVLSAGGGAVGLLVASIVLEWLVRTRQAMARVEAIHIDGAVTGFTLGLIVLCAVFSGLISFLPQNGHQVLASLQEASRSYSAGQARTRLRKILLSVEVGLTVMLLIAAGLLLKSYAKLRSSDLGCITQNVLTMNLSLPQVRYPQPEQRVQFFETLLTRVRNLPGVRAAALVSTVPGGGYDGDNGFRIAGRPPLPPGRMQLAIHHWCDPGYFAALGIPILQGHTFDEDQMPGHAREAIISESFARQYFPGEDPIGKYLLAWDSSNRIVGVVGDTKFTVSQPAGPTMYGALYAFDFMNSAALVVRSTRDVNQFALPIQRMVQQLDRDLPVSDILTMDQIIGKSTLDASFDATLLLVFSVLSLALAAVGLFGVLSYVGAQRTTEIGIRVALGAQRGQVMRLMLKDGLQPALFGLLLGLLASLGTTRLIRSMLYRTDPLDPIVIVLVALTVLLVATGACALPAWRASRLNPMKALRME